MVEKKSSPKKIETKTKSVKKTDPLIKNEKKYPLCNFIKFLLTVIISALIAISIVITTPLWMDKVLPAEKQPAFLRKALMPVTNVKVIRSKPLPNQVENMIAKADENLINKFNNMEQDFINKINQCQREKDEEITEIKKSIEDVKETTKNITQNWKNKSMQYKMFLVSFYNTYEKILDGKSYARELELMELNTDPGMLIHKDLPFIKSYSLYPPRSMKALGDFVNKNQNLIIAEEIKTNEKGLKQKLLLAVNYMFTIEAPIEKTTKGSLKYNLKTFINATQKIGECRDSDCKAMEYGILLSKQSEWFRHNVLNELEARYKLNRQIKLIRHKIEKEIYQDEISNLSNIRKYYIKNKLYNTTKK